MNLSMLSLFLFVLILPTCCFSQCMNENPLSTNRFYTNPTFQNDIQQSVATAKPGKERTNLAIMRDVPSAYWLDVKYKSQAGNDSTTFTAEGILKHAAEDDTSSIVTFVIYNLPNRDWYSGAKASNGEICCAKKRNKDGRCNFLDTTDECEHGLEEYKSEYIDEIAESIEEYCDRVPMALIIEPDSLPNLVTNLENPRCGNKATQKSYIEGVEYAVRKLSAACPSASIYVDAAHGSWLGWTNNHKKLIEMVRDMDIVELIRGFSINVSNYNQLGKPCPSVGFCLTAENRDHECCEDSCELTTAFNPAHNELNYAMVLHNATKEMFPSSNPHIVIDTSRNGRDSRKNCANWCNVRGAGAGLIPTTDTALPDIVDAYMWIKTPGESDGCTEELPNQRGKCPRFDELCASDESIGSLPGEPRAPEASGWFDYQIKMLARNALFRGV